MSQHRKETIKAIISVRFIQWEPEMFASNAFGIFSALVE